MKSSANKQTDEINPEPLGLKSICGLDMIRYLMLCCATLAQIATVMITWELWHDRGDPPNLPMFDVPQISFGIWLVLSLVLVFFKPKLGFWIHVVLLVVASAFDQFRMQPQFLALVLLMWASIYEIGKRVSRWFLAALWIWAGVHKLLSPHWFAHAGHWMLTAMSFSDAEANKWHWYFAMIVAVAEIVAGIAAVVRPKTGAVLGAVMHLSIFVLLIFINWNFSVLPWNLATAIVGFWILWTVSAGSHAIENRQHRIECVVACILFIAPAGFFWGLLDHGYANVLYSDCVPRALITSPTELREIKGWHPVHVPFPYERRTHRQFFEEIGNEGDKLHIHDPRIALPDLFFVIHDGSAKSINRADFFDTKDESCAGVAIDDRHARFWLRQKGTVVQRWYRGRKHRRKDNLVSYAYTLKPSHYSTETLKLLKGLPNLEQLQLSGCAVIDEHLKLLTDLKQLSGIGLSGTGVTDAGLKYLEQLPNLQILEVENTQISPGGLQKLKESLGR